MLPNRQKLLLLSSSISSKARPYHFYVASLLPIISFLVQNEKKLTNKVVMLEKHDDEDLQKWLEFVSEVFAELEIRFIAPADCVNLVIRKSDLRYGFFGGPKIKLLPLFDKPSFLSSRKMRRAIKNLEDFKNRINLEESDIHEVLIINRSSKRQTRKLDRRISNLEEVRLRVEQAGFSIKVVDFASMDPLQVIQDVHNCNFLIGQHGAGLVHLFWQRQNSTNVVEIFGPEKDLPFVPWVYKHLAKSKGITYQSVPCQQSWTGKVDTKLLIKSLRGRVGVREPGLFLSEIQLERAAEFLTLVRNGGNFIGRKVKARFRSERAR